MSARGRKRIGVCLPPKRIGLESRFFFSILLSLQGPWDVVLPGLARAGSPAGLEESEGQAGSRK